MQDVVNGMLRPASFDKAAQKRHEEAAARVEVQVGYHCRHDEDQAEADSHYGRTS